MNIHLELQYYYQWIKNTCVQRLTGTPGCVRLYVEDGIQIVFVQHLVGICNWKMEWKSSQFVRNSPGHFSWVLQTNKMGVPGKSLSQNLC